MLKKNSLIGRILIGTGLAFAVTCIILYTTREILTILVIIWILGATIEFIKILRTAEINLSLGLLILLNLSAALTAYFQLLPEFLIVPIGVIFFSSIAQRHRLPRIPVYGLFTFIYLGFLPSHLILLSSLVAEKHLSPWITMFPLILTWTNDTAAYAIGRLIGKRQLAPALSPNKTVEGFIAGTAFSALLSWFWLPKIITFSDQPSWLWALSGAVLGIVAQAGDLFESLFKRAAGIKDSSNILGAHGGFLDRMDSLLFTIPAFYYLLRLFSP